VDKKLGQVIGEERYCQLNLECPSKFAQRDL
jgi:hypothetical protein